MVSYSLLDTHGKINAKTWQSTANLKNIQAAAQARKDNLSKKPPWKL